MAQFKPQPMDTFDLSPFKLIGKDWMLITAEKEGKCNAMTASWGGLGIMWGKPVAFIGIRPQRYTKEFVDGSASLSLSVLDEQFRKELHYFGTVSGRNEDKIAKSGFTVSHQDGVPYFEEAKHVFICKKLYAQPMDASHFIDKDADEKWYPQKDYHTLYIAEIESLLTKES